MSKLCCFSFFPPHFFSLVTLATVENLHDRKKFQQIKFIKYMKNMQPFILNPSALWGVSSAWFIYGLFQDFRDLYCFKSVFLWA